jgi:RNA-directed DNA polymerase
VSKKHLLLFEQIASFRALIEAAARAICGKRGKPGAAAFMANLESNLLRIEQALKDGTWRSGSYTVIEVKDPKPRMVSAAPFADRVVHHALCAVVAPIFERGYIDDSFANRKGFGTHRAIARYEHYRDRYQHVLRCDIYRYFPSIDHTILKKDVRRRIGCAPTLDLLDAIIDGSNQQEPVNLLFPDDDLFSPYTRRRGLPIGNLTSQLFGNLYLDGLDHFIKEVLRVPGYVRYVDDFALFHDDPNMLAQWRERIAVYLEGRRLILHPVKTQILPTCEPAEFLGLLLLEGGWRRLPEASLRRFRNRLRGLRDRWRAGTIAPDEVEQRVRSWIAHAEHAHTWRLRHAIFRGGCFDPARKPDHLPDGRMLRGGSWNNKPQNLRSANRNRNDTTNRNNNNGFRLASMPSFAGAGAFKDAFGVQEGVHRWP